MSTNGFSPLQEELKPIHIHFHGQHGSIHDGMRWDNVPPFAVLTGKNGVGKSQLLEVVASTFNALSNPDPRSGRRAIEPRPTSQMPHVSIEGAAFITGEVFHSYSSWQMFGGGAANAEGVIESIRTFCNREVPVEIPWYIAQLAALAQPPVTPEQASSFDATAIERHITPYLLWGKTLPRGQTNLAFLFLAYRMLQSTALLNGRTPMEIRNKYGEEPWNVLNEILTAAGLAFRVLPPEVPEEIALVQPTRYSLRIKDIERDCEVPYESLSSGERVIMSTALWLFGAQTVGRHYALLLLDEPDAALHPSMTRRFIDVLQRVFVEERGVRVIMTTHSPSTVALVPESSLFEMTRATVPRIRPAESRADAIAGLTDGFVIAHEGMKIVLCEGVHDAPFYRVIWERLTDSTLRARDSYLPKLPSLVFMHGQGVTTVKAIIPQLRQAGLTHFHGLIDRDSGNRSADGLHVIGRRTLENYLLDPINVWCLLHEIDQAPSVPQVKIQRGQRHQVRDLPQAALQGIADSVLTQVERKLPDLTTNEQERQIVEFVGGVSLSYPRWLLDRSKVDLNRAFGAALPGATRGGQGNNERLTTSFASLALIPVDLLEVLRSIQGVKPSES